MDLEKIKEKIKEQDLIPAILEDIGCRSIKRTSSGFRSTSPNGDNPTSLSIFNENLYVSIFSDGFKGNIFSFVMEYKKMSFKESIIYLCNKCKIEYEYENKKKKSNSLSPIDIFKNVSTHKKADKKTIEDVEIELKNIERYHKKIHIDWIREGIVESTRKEFGILYDYYKKRIVIPHRKWNTGDIVGVMSRNMMWNKDMDKISKYFPIFSHKKGNNIFGLYENYAHIQKNRNVYVYESEKSVFKRHSKGDKTCVAVCTKDITDEQTKILIGLDVDINICFDKDVDLLQIYKVCDKFYGIRNVYYVYDSIGVLGEKDAPADTNNVSYKKLINSKIKYDDREKKKYEKLKEKEKNKIEKERKESWMSYE